MEFNKCPVSPLLCTDSFFFPTKISIKSPLFRARKKLNKEDWIGLDWIGLKCLGNAVVAWTLIRSYRQTLTPFLSRRSSPLPPPRPSPTCRTCDTWPRGQGRRVATFRNKETNKSMWTNEPMDRTPFALRKTQQWYVHVGCGLMAATLKEVSKDNCGLKGDKHDSCSGMESVIPYNCDLSWPSPREVRDHEGCCRPLYGGLNLRVWTK